MTRKGSTRHTEILLWRNHDMNLNQVFDGCFGTVWRLHSGGTRGPSAKSDGLTATEDDVQLLVRNVVLLVWVGGQRRCWIATSEIKGIL